MKLQVYEVKAQVFSDGRTIKARKAARIGLPIELVNGLGLKGGEKFDVRVLAVNPPRIELRMVEQ